MENCKNCGSPLHGPYCSQCGQPYIERHRIAEVIGYLTEILELERGLLRTAYDLLIRPGVLVRSYLHGKTKPYQNPLRFLMTVVAISVFVQVAVIRSTASEMAIHSFAAVYILCAATGFWLFFRKQPLNFFEHLIITTYTIGKMYLILIALALLQHFMPPDTLTNGTYKLLELLVLLYASLRITIPVFRSNWWGVFLIVLVTLGSILFSFLVSILLFPYITALWG